MSVTLLAIESSCDDTAAAVLRDGRVLSNRIANQKVHAEYGGVVPELASRAHLANIVPVVEAALREAGVDKTNLDGVAFTRGPGLIGSLLVGVSFAKALALSLDIPLLEVHHMHAHVLAHLIDEPRPAFPFLCLTVSGGHTQIVRVDGPLAQTVIGRTRDDAAGEAFDKTGKLLGLEYPAGPIIDKLARGGRPIYPFPEPDIAGLDFSFSGLKTSIRYFLQKQLKADPNFIEHELANICASVQERIVSILLLKFRTAAEQTGITRLAIAGGVSANSGLREGLSALGEQHGYETFIPAFQYCTDNAGMIAIAGYHQYLAGQFSDQGVTPSARMPG